MPCCACLELDDLTGFQLAGQARHLPGAFLGARHAHPGMGESQEFRRKDGFDDPPAGGRRNAEADWKSSDDPDARLFSKSKQRHG
jgi:hypothetical protein